jgi:hypothetical protein
MEKIRTVTIFTKHDDVEVTEIFRGIPQLLQAKAEVVHPLGKSRLLLNPFQFISSLAFSGW